MIDTGPKVTQPVKAGGLSLVLPLAALVARKGISANECVLKELARVAPLAPGEMSALSLAGRWGP